MRRFLESVKTTWRLAQLLDSPAVRAQRKGNGESLSRFVLNAVHMRLSPYAVADPGGHSGPLDDFWLAIVEDSHMRGEPHEESFFLWRVDLPGAGQALVPVVASDAPSLREQTERIRPELIRMDGPPVRWHRFAFVPPALDEDWLRSPKETKGE